MREFKQADSKTSRARSYKSWLKKAKRRHERRRAKRKPDCNPAYGKYRGYQL